MPDAEPLWAGVRRACSPAHVLVVDIGGGTSDFSLFEVRPGASGSIPDIRRVAVSEHILLGGDNIDLALAVLLEMRTVRWRTRPHFRCPRGISWSPLCRDLKEKALSGSATADDRFAVALPGRGSGLIAGAQTANLARDEVERLVLDGFFPQCDARARPYRRHGALQEWGFPMRPTAR